MGGGLAFLTKKQFNPANISNQKRVWEAEQRAEKEAKAAKERAEQLRRERDDEELARARGGKTGGDRAALSFMYAVPPGLADEKKGATRGVHVGGDEDELEFGLLGYDDDERKPAAAMATTATTTAVSASASTNFVQRQPGDDDAAAAFRAMLAGHHRPADDEIQHASEPGPSKNALVGSEYDPSAGPASGGASGAGGASGGDNRTQLEKAVGRRDAYNTALTLEEQVARFPSLKNAPMAPGMKADNVNVSFKPLGAEIRNVKCLVCGIWGHSKGDRECKVSGWNPFALGSDSVPAAPAAVHSSTTGPTSRTSKAHQSTDIRHSDEKKSSSGRKRDCSSDSSNSSSSESSSSDFDSSEEERRRRRRKKKGQRLRSKKSGRSHRHEADERRHSRKKKRKHGRDRKKGRHGGGDGGYYSDDSASYNSYEEPRRRRKREKRKRSRHHRRDRSRSST